MLRWNFLVVIVGGFIYKIFLNRVIISVLCLGLDKERLFINVGKELREGINWEILIKKKRGGGIEENG